jgi:hypothetical protein
VAQTGPKLFRLIGVCADVVRSEELRIAQRDVEALGTTARQDLPGRLGVVVGADFCEEVAVQLEGVARTERVHRVAEAAIVVSLLEAVVQSGQVESARKDGVVRMLAEGLVVVREGFGPAAR